MAQIDQRVIERLAFDTMQDAEAASLSVLLPGEQPPANPSACFVQLAGVDFEYPAQGSGVSGADYASVVVRVVVTCPPVVTSADAGQVQTACTQVLNVMRRISVTSGDHQLDLDTARTQTITPDDELNGLRLAVIELRGTATRTTGTSTE